MKFAFRTLGCKMNQLDSARLTASLEQAGHLPVHEENEADVVFVNTCTVTAQADKKSRQAAAAARRGPRQVAVLGCSVRVDAEQWRQRDPELCVYESDAELLHAFEAAADASLLPVTRRTRLPVAIQTGCDDICTFCITTVARGDHRSLPVARIVDQVRRAADSGVREVVLTGINLAAWGSPDSRKCPDRARLHELLEALLTRTEIPRIRLSSLGPQYLQPAFFDVLENQRICDYLHLSIQSGSPTVLRRMARGHDAETVFRVAKMARQRRPDVALAADFIAGFPGETEAEFAETLTMAERIGLAKLHVFPFSPREGTAAARLPDQVPPPVRKARAAALRELGRGLRRTFLAGQMGRVQRVLIEQHAAGHSTNYIQIQVPGSREGDLVAVPLTRDNLADRFQ